MTALVPPPRPIGAESTSLRTSGPLRRNGAMKMEWATTTQWPPCSGASVGTAQRSLSYRCRRSTRHRTRTRPFRLPSRHASSFDHTSGTWHISENFLAGLGRKVDCSGIDDMLTNAGVFSSATATAGNFVRAKDRAASRAWNLGHREFVDSLTSMLPVLCAFDRPVCARFVACRRRMRRAPLWRTTFVSRTACTAWPKWTRGCG
mmetsp:Transcript_22392/g.58358  ORF Transcript_22392/g.58358 Transcript_22392/m.58358 type:complete len:204 (-) Transcript_22392:2035-2646(-)